MVHHSNAGMSVVTSLNFELTTELNSTTPTFTLTCTSSGGPVTTVSWMRDGEVLTENGNYYTSLLGYVYIQKVPPTTTH